jgi:cytosine/adenosine deaminase-related metal-dependent hydrolase
VNIISPKWIVTCDDSFNIFEDYSIVFDEKIIDIDLSSKILEKYPNANNIEVSTNSILMPGLINSHIHLEFSANKTSLKYGDFIVWLNSVIKNRDNLIEKATKELIDQKLRDLIKNGTTTIGAISSYGYELESCANSPMNVIFFNEVIGSKPDMIDTLFADFKARVKNSQAHDSDSFKSAVAIHSPYSVHPFLIREVLKIADQNQMPVTAHFLESDQEREWLDSSKGAFEDFFKNFLNQTRSLTTPEEFIKQFKNSTNISLTHCVEVDNHHLKMINKCGASIIHCPNSNRLLSKKTLNIESLDELNNINLAIGTDGLSSNYSLNLFDELRSALFMHTSIEPNALAQKLLYSATKGSAKALGVDDRGSIEKNKIADMILFDLDVESKEDIALHTILHEKNITHTFIRGKNELH